MSEKSLEVINLHKRFDEIIAVNDISFSTKKGEIIALLGPNGAGKSTIMNMITGYLAPSGGTIKVLGKDINQHPLEAKKAIGFLPEGSPLYPDISVKQFIKYIAEIRRVDKERINDVINAAKIDNILNQKIETLSKGYQRRVGFAQSILSDPEILLLDEPTDGLDPNQKEHIRELIKHMGKNKTIIISTHLLEEAETICNRIILLNKGQIIVDGSLYEVLRETKSTNLHDAFKKATR